MNTFDRAWQNLNEKFGDNPIPEKIFISLWEVLNKLNTGWKWLIDRDSIRKNGTSTLDYTITLDKKTYDADKHSWKCYFICTTDDFDFESDFFTDNPQPVQTPGLNATEEYEFARGGSAIYKKLTDLFYDRPTSKEITSKTRQFLATDPSIDPLLIASSHLATFQFMFLDVPKAYKDKDTGEYKIVPGTKLIIRADIEWIYFDNFRTSHKQKFNEFTCRLVDKLNTGATGHLVLQDPSNYLIGLRTRMQDALNGSGLANKYRPEDIYIDSPIELDIDKVRDWVRDHLTLGYRPAAKDRDLLSLFIDKSILQKMYYKKIPVIYLVYWKAYSRVGYPETQAWVSSSPTRVKYEIPECLIIGYTNISNLDDMSLDRALGLVMLNQVTTSKADEDEIRDEIINSIEKVEIYIIKDTKEEFSTDITVEFASFIENYRNEKNRAVRRQMYEKTKKQLEGVAYELQVRDITGEGTFKGVGFDDHLQALLNNDVRVIKFTITDNDL